MRKCHNIVLIGPVGAGKTSLGKLLADEINWDFYDSDNVLEERSGVNLLWIYDLEGHEGLRKREEFIIGELVQQSRIVLSTGGESVASLKNRNIIRKYGLVVYLAISLDDQLLRTGYGKKRPLSMEDSERLSTLVKLQKEYLPIYKELADISYSTTNKHPKVVVADLIELIKNNSRIRI